MHTNIKRALLGATALTILSLASITPSYAASSMCGHASMKSDETMKDDAMMKDDMAHEDMAKDGMAKEEMMEDTMSDDAMMKDDKMEDGMAKDDAMAKADTMSDDAMMKDDMKSGDMMMADYTVKAGDSLWSIAAETLCDGDKYHVIVDANKDMLHGSMTVHPGQVLHVPGD